MRGKLIVILGGLLMAIGAWFLKGNVQVDYTTDAWAAAGNSAVSAACTDPSQAGFVPGIAYSIAWVAPSAGAGPAVDTATATLSGNVMSDTNPAVTATMNGAGAPAGHVVLVNQTPNMKLDGIACQAVTQSELKAKGDGTDNPAFNTAISNLADANNAYTAGDNIDVTSTDKMLFGSSGLIQTGLVTDAADRAGVADAQVEFGGNSEANGGSEMHSFIKVIGYDPQAGTDVETLTFTFTGS